MNQAAFDAQYITTTEIMQNLLVNRTTVLARVRTGFLPEGIKVGNCLLWERELIQPKLDDWKQMLTLKRAS